MKLKIALALVLLVGGCHASEPQTPEETGEMPYGKWGFAFFTPHALPAVVTYAALIDSSNVVSKFRTLDGTLNDSDTVQGWSNTTNSGSIYFNKARHPPVSMVFCWDSIIDKKTYETQIVFEPSLRETMLTPTGTDRYGNTAWYKTMLFGLAPEGKVKIWLQDSAGGKISHWSRNASARCQAISWISVRELLSIPMDMSITVTPLSLSKAKPTLTATGNSYHAHQLRCLVGVSHRFSGQAG